MNETYLESAGAQKITPHGSLASAVDMLPELLKRIDVLTDRLLGSQPQETESNAKDIIGYADGVFGDLLRQADAVRRFAKQANAMLSRIESHL